MEKEKKTRSESKIGNQYARKHKNGTGNYAIEHAGLVTSSRFQNRVDAWDFAFKNYKGKEGLKLWKIVKLPAK